MNWQLHAAQSSAPISSFVARQKVNALVLEDA